MDEYWQRTDPDKYAMNIRKAVIATKKLNKFTTLRAAIISASLGSKIGMNGIKYWGLKSIKEAQRELRVMETNEKIKHHKDLKDKATKNAFNFYKDLTMLEQILKREINEDTTTVGKWIELVKIGEQITKESKKNKEAQR